MDRRRTAAHPTKHPHNVSRRFFLGAALALGTSSLLVPSVASSQTDGGHSSAPARRQRSTRHPSVTAADSSRSTLGAAVTSSVSQWSIRDFGATGRGDDTRAIQAALSAAMDNAVIIVPPGVYTYSGDLTLRGARGLTLVGSGAASVLRSSNADASALHIADCDDLAVRDLVIEGTATSRSRASAANGLNLWHVKNASITGVTVRRVATAGIYISDNSSAITVERCTVDHSYADGLQIVGASDIRVSNCVGIETGDDSFSSIGYEHIGINRRISFIGCQSSGSAASGVALEGTDDGSVSGCTVERSGVAGIRVHSASSYKTLGCDRIKVSGNSLTECKTNPSVGHASIELAAANGDLLNIEVRNNSIWRPLSSPLHSVGYPPYQVQVVFSGNTLDGELIS